MCISRSSRAGIVSVLDLSVESKILTINPALSLNKTHLDQL